MSTDRDYLAAGLALGGLSEAELAEAQTLADTDTDFRSEVAEYEDTMALMAESDAEASESSATDAPEPISAATRNAILAIPSTHAQEDVAAQPQSLEQARSAQQQTQSSAQPPERPQSQSRSQAPADADPPPPADLAEHRRKRRPWVSMAAAAAVVVVAAGVGVSSWQKQNELEDELAAAQQQLDDSARLMEAGDLKTSTSELPEGGSVTVLSSEKEQLIRFSPRDVEISPAGKSQSLQMWVIGKEGPESVGLMTNAPVTIADEPFAKGSLFGVTVEPEGGSEQPTTDPIVAISL